MIWTNYKTNHTRSIPLRLAGTLPTSHLWLYHQIIHQHCSSAIFDTDAYANIGRPKKKHYELDEGNVGDDDAYSGNEIFLGSSGQISSCIRKLSTTFFQIIKFPC